MPARYTPPEDEPRTRAEQRRAQSDRYDRLAAFWTTTAIKYRDGSEHTRQAHVTRYHWERDAEGHRHRVAGKEATAEFDQVRAALVSARALPAYGKEFTEGHAKRFNRVMRNLGWARMDISDEGLEDIAEGDSP